MISTKETKGASGPNAVWNAPFLFDLPPGDIIRLPLVLEFIVMQVSYNPGFVSLNNDLNSFQHTTIILTFSFSIISNGNKYFSQNVKIVSLSQALYEL